jgi:hypothetical protein
MQLLELEDINSPFTDKSQIPEWDEIDLSTPENRKELMEVLICQKAKRGEDITQCLKVLDYLKRRTEENKLYDILAQEVRERSIFNSLQRVCITSFAILGMIAFSHGVLSRSQNPTVSNSVERNQFFSESDAVLPTGSNKPDGIANAYRTHHEQKGKIQGQFKSDEQ